jgi:anti-anti-sigma regulatory factor
MATKTELEARIAELEAAYVIADTLNQISRDVNAARDEDEVLHALARLALEAGAIRANLYYIDLDEASEPEWAEKVAVWQREGEPPKPVGSRYYLPEFPLFHLWVANPDEPLFMSDIATDERIDDNVRKSVLAQTGSRASLTFLLTQGGRWVGLFTCVWEEPHEFSEREKAIYRGLVGLISPAVENRRLLARAQQALIEREQAEAERERLQQEVIEAQKRALQELSTPIIPVMERIIVMPLIGSIDTLRAKDIMRVLLAGIRQHRAKVVILDVTGVPVVDSGVANHLNKTIQAARLKGAQTIVTGLSDAVAEAIVDLGIDWSGVETRADLQTGLMVALKSLGVKLGKA